MAFVSHQSIKKSSSVIRRLAFAPIQNDDRAGSPHGRVPHINLGKNRIAENRRAQIDLPQINIGEIRLG